MRTFKYHWFKGGIRIKFHKTENFICKNQIWKLKLDIPNTVFNWKLHSLTLIRGFYKKKKNQDVQEDWNFAKEYKSTIIMTE